MKLYKAATHPRQWIAYSPETGWMAFPIKINGWLERRPVRGLDPVHLRAVPPAQAAAAGFPAETDESGTLRAA